MEKTAQEWLAIRRAKEDKKRKYPKLRGRKYTVIYERDGGVCQIANPDVCDGPVKYLEGTLDHIHPYSHGGEGTPVNLQLACRPCNAEKANEYVECVCGLPPGGPGCRWGIESAWKKYVDNLEWRMLYIEWRRDDGPKLKERWTFES